MLTKDNCDFDPDQQMLRIDDPVMGRVYYEAFPYAEMRPVYADYQMTKQLRADDNGRAVLLVTMLKGNMVCHEIDPAGHTALEGLLQNVGSGCVYMGRRDTRRLVAV